MWIEEKGGAKWFKINVPQRSDIVVIVLLKAEKEEEEEDICPRMEHTFDASREIKAKIEMKCVHVSERCL